VKEPRSASLAQILCGSKERERGDGDDALADVVRAAAADHGDRGRREREWGKGSRRGHAARCPGQGTGARSRGRAGVDPGGGRGWDGGEEREYLRMGERRGGTPKWGWG
jgi:hypothetical protein